MATMTAGLPSEREMRFAVDRLHRQSGLRDAEVRATMTAWAEVVLDIAAVIWRNWPEPFGGLTPGQVLTTAQQVPEDHLDPVLRWGMAWAVKARWSFIGLLDVHTSLAAINPKDEDALRFVPGEVLDEIASWADRYPAVVELARLSADDLNAAYPATDWSDEHRSSESDEEIG
jgi:hypothetical protein